VPREYLRHGEKLRRRWHSRHEGERWFFQKLTESRGVDNVRAKNNWKWRILVRVYGGEY